MTKTMERRAITFTVDGEEIEITQDNHDIWQFRDEPEIDYMELRPDDGLTEEQRRIMIQRQRRLLLWMGKVATQPEDEEIITEMEAEHGEFSGLTGWNSPVNVRDEPTDTEREWAVQGLLNDLRNAEGADDLLG